MDWEYFNKFDSVSEKYLPARGEGDTMASQIVTAVNKIVYKWYNDGDVYDNTYAMEGWANDLSSYANWLYAHTPARNILKRIEKVSGDEEYENEILAPLADFLFNEDVLKKYEVPAEGTIYECSGPFEYREPREEYDEDDWWDEEEEEEDWEEEEDED